MVDADPRVARLPLTYRSSGVDIDAGNEAVRRIRGLAARTRRPEQIDSIGGFAGMIGLPSGMKDPVLVSSTDGVGTKLLVAIAIGRHDTVGIDLVAMNVNDVLCTGASPLFLLDYIACGRLDPSIVEALVAGVVEGCVQSGCALLGGETAEMPGLYADGHYDLAAFVVGVVERTEIWGPERTRLGDAILALPSTGLHSNGYSLARKALLSPEYAGLNYQDPLPTAPTTTVGQAMLAPTAIYARALTAIRSLPVRAAAHITGGGLLENPPRSFDDAFAARLDLREVPVPPIFPAIAAQGVGEDEMRRTFNMGIGMLLFVDRERTGEIQGALESVGQASYVVGSLVERSSGAEAVQFVE